jgi:hypothetical protein
MIIFDPFSKYLFNDSIDFRLSVIIKCRSNSDSFIVVVVYTGPSTTQRQTKLKYCKVGRGAVI